MAQMKLPIKLRQEAVGRPSIGHQLVKLFFPTRSPVFPDLNRSRHNLCMEN